MIDNFSILLSHGLLLISFWILIQRSDVNAETPPEPDSVPDGFAKTRSVTNKAVRPAPLNPMRRPSASRKAREQESRTLESGEGPADA